MLRIGCAAGSATFPCQRSRVPARHPRRSLALQRRSGLTQYAKLVREHVDHAVAKAKAERLEKGIKLVGRKGVLRQRWNDSPNTREPRRGLSPRVACRNKWARIEALQRNKVFLDLAKARYQVGQATMLDTRQAEVTLGQSQVDLLVARQQNADARLELYRLMGVPAPEGFEQVRLTDSFPVVQPTFTLDTLLGTAAEVNPNLRAAEAASDASRFNLTAVKSEYLPTLRAQAGWSGYTQNYTDTTAASGSNSGDYPWGFIGQPFQVFAGLSLPIFDGLNRETRVSQAKAQRDDATEQVRAQALLIRSQVTSRYLAVGTTYQGISVAEANRIAAHDQLRLAQDRYRLGQGTALELSDSEGAVQRAEGTYVDAVYGYHKAVAALEEAVGQPLR